MRLTEEKVSQLNLPPGKTELIIFDDQLPGFGLRLRLGGARSFVVQYRVKGRQRRQTLGSAFELTLTSARRAALEVLDNISTGKDPRGQPLAGPERVLFGRLVDRYLRQQKSGRDINTAGHERNLHVLWKPLHALWLDQVDQKAVTNCLMMILQMRGRSAAAQALQSLAVFYAWALERGHCSHAPLVLSLTEFSLLLKDSDLRLSACSLRCTE